ncbi:MAG: 6-phosphofructokinase [Hyphomicrobium sp.]|nr:6-phosphofructokinase [Hyphomicrobium sp.]
MKQNALYGQSGGVTAVINASACGAIEAARRHGHIIGKMFAAPNGIMGALDEDLIDTTVESDDAIAALRHTPAGAFGSCRFKLEDFDIDRRRYERLIAVCKAHNIGYFLYNGGGDSADTCIKIAQFAETVGYPLQSVLIPKTIDNDLFGTDTCPGFGSVAKYIAVSTREASFDVRSMSRSSTKVFVFEVMGRHSGWIAAAGALAADSNHDLPIAIVFPEITFDNARLIARVRAMVDRYGYCTVVVSEGVKRADGRFLAEQGTNDAFGHSQLGGAAPIVAGILSSALGYKCHWAVADYLQRSARHVASRIDVDQAYAVGKAAVEMAIAGENAIMPTIVRTSGEPYTWAIGKVPLAEVANVEKLLPQEFISADGFGITNPCRAYLLPLIQGEDYPPYKNGLPTYITLKNKRVPKQLRPFEL